MRIHLARIGAGGQNDLLPKTNQENQSGPKTAATKQNIMATQKPGFPLTVLRSLLRAFSWS